MSIAGCESILVLRWKPLMICEHKLCLQWPKTNLNNIHLSNIEEGKILLPKLFARVPCSAYFLPYGYFICWVCNFHWKDVAAGAFTPAKKHKRITESSILRIGFKTSRNSFVRALWLTCREWIMSGMSSVLWLSTLSLLSLVEEVAWNWGITGLSCRIGAEFLGSTFLAGREPWEWWALSSGKPGVSGIKRDRSREIHSRPRLLGWYGSGSRGLLYSWSGMLSSSSADRLCGKNAWSGVRKKSISVQLSKQIDACS